jgi:hypothetical protein
LRRVKKNQAKMRRWAAGAACNFSQKYSLVQAELARVRGEHLLAMKLYEQAIAEAIQNNYLSDEALAYELSARFYAALGHASIAQHYMLRAFDTYYRWGALRQCETLKAAYPYLSRPAKRGTIIGKQTIAQTIAKTSAQNGTRHRTDSTYSGTNYANTVTMTAPTQTSSTSSDALDLATVIKASQALSTEMDLARLLQSIMLPDRKCWRGEGRVATRR